MTLQFSENAKKEISAKMEQLPEKGSALIPALYIAQREFRYLSPEVMEYRAGELGIPVSEVRAVATFYTMFHKEPVGKYHIQVCQNLTCSLLGALLVGFAWLLVPDLPERALLLVRTAFVD